MTESVFEAAADAYIEHVKNGRRGTAVLKYRLINLRSQLPNVLVFAFEGDDDKIAYYQWIKRIRANLEYEPFPCSGKRYVLEFREMLARDLGGLANGIYYFVDRDYDDLAGHEARDDTFVTDNYSVENYLVTDTVLVELLRNEFHCHARPEVRDTIINRFNAVYKEFLTVSKDINLRIFIAKRLGLLGSSVPQKVGTFAVVELNGVQAMEMDLQKVITWNKDPAPDEVCEKTVEFEELDPPTRYRGKFALNFFEKWLSLLADDYADANSTCFAALNERALSKVRRNEVVLSSLASKSDLPHGLSDFVMAITPMATA